VSDSSDESTALDELTVPDESVEATESDESAESEESKKSRVGVLMWLLLAVSVVAVVVAFLSWRDADNDPDRARAALRDTAVVEGTAAVETMTSMDGRDVEAGIKAWQGVSTGVLHDQLLSVGADEQKMLADQGKIASGRVVQAALTELTDRSATLIAAVEVTVKSADGSEDPAVKRNRFSADLVLVNGQWKIENLQQVAVNI
jgi:Mce-associated membrane protein